MAEKRQIILDIQARTGDIAKRIDKINLELVQNSETLKQLNKDYKQGLVSQEQYAKQSARLKEDTKGLRGELRDLTKQQELNTRATNAAEGSNEQLRAQLSLLTREYNKLSKEERENSDAGKELQRTIKGISDALKENESAVGDNRRNVGNYQESIENAIGSLGGFGGQLGSLATGIVAGGGIVAAIGLLTDGVIAAGEAIVETTKEFTNYRRQVEQITGATDEAARQIVASVEGISQTFDVDFNETLRSANALAKQFGIDVPQALDLIEESFIKGGNAGGDLLDTITEYSTQFEAAGLGAEAFISIATQQVSSGIFSDKGVDAIKEALLRIRELPQPTREALDAIGLTSDQIAEDLANGSTTVFEVIQQVSGKLNELPPQSAEVGQAIADIFGGPGEDAGLAYLQSLQDIDLELANVGDSTNELAQQQRSQLNAEKQLAEQQAILAQNFDSVVNGAGNLFTVIQAELLEAFNSLSEAFKPLIGAVQSFFGEIGKVVESLGFASGETNIFQGVINGLSNTLNLLLTPLRFLITGISEMIGFVREAYQESTIFRGVIDALISPFRSVYTLVTNTSAAVAGFKAAFASGFDFVAAQAELLLVNIEILANKVKEFFNSGDEVENKIRELESRKAELSSVGADLGDAFTEAYNAAVQGKIDPIAPEVDTNIVEDNIEEVTKEAGKSLKELKDELSKLQEAFDSATTSATRAAIAAQIKELQAQIDSAQQVLKTATAEKKAAAPDTSSFSLDIPEPDPDNDPVILAEEARIAKQRELDQQAKEDALRRDAKFYERLSAFRKKKADEQLKEREAEAQREIEIERLRQQSQIDTANAIVAATQLGIDLLGESTAAGKALGIVQATVSTFVAANRALAEGGAIAGPILAAVAIATGLANVAQIVRAADGGYISGPGTGTSDSIPAMLSNGESVITARATSQYWPVLDAINQSAGGNPIRPRFANGGIATFANGGLASAVSASVDGGAFSQQQAALQNANAQSALLNDTIANMPAPIVTVKDISSASNRVRVKQNTRSL